MDGRHVPSCLVLNSADGLVPFLAAVGIDAIESDLLSGEEEGPYTLRNILNDLSWSCGPVREVPSSAETASANGISARRTAECTASQVRTESRCKRSASSEAANAGSYASGLVGAGIRLGTPDHRSEGTSGTS